jgi:hypothetical protein
MEKKVAEALGMALPAEIENEVDVIDSPVPVIIPLDNPEFQDLEELMDEADDQREEVIQAGLEILETSLESAQNVEPKYRRGVMEQAAMQYDKGQD